MKKYLPLSILFFVMTCSVGCQLPDFSAGRLAHPFPSETTVGTDPFAAEDFQPDLSSPHTSAAPRTFAQTPSAVPKSSSKGRARVTAYAPPTPQTNLQLDRPSAPFQQAVYETTIPKKRPEQNRFASVENSEMTDPFGTSGIQQASFEEPAPKPMPIQQTATTQNPFAAKSMKQAHTPQVKSATAESNPFDDMKAEEVVFPTRQKPAPESDQWRRSGETTSLSTRGVDAGGSQFMPPTQRQ